MFLRLCVCMALDGKYLVFGFPTAKKGPLLVGTGGAVLAGGVVLTDGTTGGAMLADGTTGGVIMADGTTGGAMLADGTTGGVIMADGTTGGVIMADGTTGGAILADGTIGGGPTLAGGTGGVTFKGDPAASMGELDSRSNGPPATAMFKPAPIGEGLYVGVDI